MAANDMTVDPNLVNQAYKSMLADSQGQVALLQAAATQLQQVNAQLRDENTTLKAKNDELMASSGRQDGVPDPGTAAE